MTDRQQKKLGELIEQKILEFFGDPDHGLRLKKSFADEIRRRMKKRQVLIAHSNVARKYGLD